MLGTHRETGDAVTIPLAKAPHLLVAGMTGSGKSMFVNALISRMVMEHTSRELGLILIDPKRVELAQFNGLPQVSAGGLFEIDDIKRVLSWAIVEMNARFGVMSDSGVRHIDRWDELRPAAALSRVVIVIDELANLILADRKIEDPIVRLASMGRAAGFHLILATQRPSADVLTGLIRANVPTRICLPVVTRMDSRIVLDEPGAETLQKPGDILARIPGQRRLAWLQGPMAPPIDEVVRQARANG